VNRLTALVRRSALLLGSAWFAFATAASIVAADAQEKVPSDEVRGVWMWSSALRQKSGEAIATQLAEHRINKVFLLVKGHSGRVCYASKLAPVQPGGKYCLKELLTACHKRGIEVHAWYVFNGDDSWGKRHPEDAMYHVGKADAWDKGPYSKADKGSPIPICPISKGYRSYLKSQVQEVLDGYDVDGIHLDYIRYGHLCYCFCPRHQAAAASRGIDLAKVRQAIYNTLYASNRQSNLYFNLYRSGDTNVAAWVKMREEEIDLAVKEIREIVKAKKPSLALSASFMPEGGEPDDVYALCHYAQNYETAGSQLDYILPMTYWKNPQWVVQIAHNAEKKSHRPIYSGLWASERTASSAVKEGDYESADAASSKVPVLKLRESVQALRAQGVKGFVLFQYGTMTDRLWQELP
jgi:uncharacterized lipoprotein YddW (UPF0748 family)